MKKNVLAVFPALLLLAGCETIDPDMRFSDDPLSPVVKPVEGKLVPEKKIRWSFADRQDWRLANQGDNQQTDGSSIENHADGDNGKVLRITTKANTKERKKLMTPKKYGSGLYTWRCYISDLGIRDRASIGSWLWHDDEHELDFEVGSGTQQDRLAMKAGSDEVIAYISSQDNPKMLGKRAKIKKNAWHTFQIDLKLVNGKYFATWLIDGIGYIAQQLDYGEEYPFYIFCSVENLSFLGDHWPPADTYGLWDYVEYMPYTYSMEPVDSGNPGDMPVDEPEVDEGETLTWDFEDSAVPTGWSGWSQGGGCTGTVQNGFLEMPNRPGCITSNFEYGTAVGYGKYTWKMRFPELAGSEKFMAGGQLYHYDEDTGQEHSALIAGWYGSDANRASLGATPGQLVLRVYSSGGLSDFGNPAMALLDPDTDYELTIELRNTGGKYQTVWMLDGQVLKTQMGAVGAEQVTFGLITTAQSDRGWMPGNANISKEYVAKFSKIEYTKE